MSWFGTKVTIKDGPQIDTFGRIRSSSPQTLFDTTQEYTAAPLVMENVTAGTGTATYTQATSSTLLSTAATTSGNRAFRQSKVYWRYQPGKSQVAKLTGILAQAGTPAGTAEARIGYFDDDNGVFFGRDSTGYFIAVRTNTSGSVVTTKTYQSSWNGDKLDGTGSSGLTVDFTKAQVFLMDLQWLGVGRVRFGVETSQGIIYVHTFTASNVVTNVYMRTANLPIRWEVSNTGGVGANISLLAICGAVESEGGASDEGGYSFSASNKGTSVSAANSATLTPILTMRLVNTFNGLTYRGHIHPKTIMFNVTSNPIYWELIWNVATLTGPAYNAVNATYSGVEFDVAATAYTGGIVIASGFAPAGVGSFGDVTAVSITDKLLLARTYAGTRDTLTVAARGIGGASPTHVSINFEEQY